MSADKLPDNIHPINTPKKKGWSGLATAKKATGPRINTPVRYTFKSKEYKLPGDIEIGYETVEITRDEIKELGTVGCDWETIENLYQVSQTDIKKIYEGVYNQGIAIMKVNIMRALINKATKADGTADRKWLTQNKMGMSDKVTTVEEKPVNEEEVRSKLETLLKKHGPKTKGE